MFCHNIIYLTWWTWSYSNWSSWIIIWSTLIAIPIGSIRTLAIFWWDIISLAIGTNYNLNTWKSIPIFSIRTLADSQFIIPYLSDRASKTIISIPIQPITTNTLILLSRPNSTTFTILNAYSSIPNLIFLTCYTLNTITETISWTILHTLITIY